MLLFILVILVSESVKIVHNEEVGSHDFLDSTRFKNTIAKELLKKKLLNLESARQQDSLTQFLQKGKINEANFQRKLDFNEEDVPSRKQAQMANTFIASSNLLFGTKSQRRPCNSGNKSQNDDVALDMQSLRHSYSGFNEEGIEVSKDVSSKDLFPSATRKRSYVKKISQEPISCYLMEPKKITCLHKDIIYKIQLPSSDVADDEIGRIVESIYRAVEGPKAPNKLAIDDSSKKKRASDDYLRSLFINNLLLGSQPKTALPAYNGNNAFFLPLIIPVSQSKIDAVRAPMPYYPGFMFDPKLQVPYNLSVNGAMDNLNGVQTIAGNVLSDGYGRYIVPENLLIPGTNVRQRSQDNKTAEDERMRNWLALMATNGYVPVDNALINPKTANLAKIDEGKVDNKLSVAETSEYLNKLFNNRQERAIYDSRHHLVMDDERPQFSERLNEEKQRYVLSKTAQKMSFHESKGSQCPCPPKPCIESTSTTLPPKCMPPIPTRCPLPCSSECTPPFPKPSPIPSLCPPPCQTICSTPQTHCSDSDSAVYDHVGTQNVNLSPNSQNWGEDPSVRVNKNAGSIQRVHYIHGSPLKEVATSVNASGLNVDSRGKKHKDSFFARLRSKFHKGMITNGTVEYKGINRNALQGNHQTVPNLVQNKFSLENPIVKFNQGTLTKGWQPLQQSVPVYQVQHTIPNNSAMAITQQPTPWRSVFYFNQMNQSISTIPPFNQPGQTMNGLQSQPPNLLQLGQLQAVQPQQQFAQPPPQFGKPQLPFSGQPVPFCKPQTPPCQLSRSTCESPVQSTVPPKIQDPQSPQCQQYPQQYTQTWPQKSLLFNPNEPTMTSPNQVDQFKPWPYQFTQQQTPPQHVRQTPQNQFPIGTPASANPININQNLFTQSPQMQNRPSTAKDHFLFKTYLTARNLNQVWPSPTNDINTDWPPQRPIYQELPQKNRFSNQLNLMQNIDPAPTYLHNLPNPPADVIDMEHNAPLSTGYLFNNRSRQLRSLFETDKRDKTTSKQINLSGRVHPEGRVKNVRLRESNQNVHERIARVRRYLQGVERRRKKLSISTAP